MKFQQQLLKFNYTTIVLIQIVCTLLWFLPFFFDKVPDNSVSISFLGKEIIEYKPLTATLIQYFFISIFGYIINFTLEKLKLIPLHNHFFYISFLFLCSVTSYAQLFNTTSISFFLLLIALHNLMKMFQSEAVFRAFNCMLFLSIAILFNIEYLWFIPFFWIAFIQLKAFTRNTFFASIFGLATSTVALVLTAYITDTLPIVENYFSMIKIVYFDLENISIKSIDIIGYFIFIVFLFYYIFVCFVHRYEQSKNIYIYTFLSTIFVIFIIIFYIINSHLYREICLLLLLLTSVFSTFYYNLKQTKSSNILLLIFIGLGIFYRIIFLLT